MMRSRRSSGKTCLRQQPYHPQEQFSDRNRRRCASLRRVRSSGSFKSETPIIPARAQDVSSTGIERRQCAAISADAYKADFPFNAYTSGETFFRPVEQGWSDFFYDIHEWMKTPPQHTFMPCMAETASQIKTEINSFLEQEGLSVNDRTALEHYITRVDALEGKGYPYMESLEIALLFPMIAGVFYFQVYEQLPVHKQQSIRLCHLDKLGERWNAAALGPCNLHNLIHQNWEQLYEDKNKPCYKTPDRYETLISMFFVVAGLTDHFVMKDRNALRGLGDHRNRRVIPVFTPFSLELLNRFHYLPIVPVGLITNIKEKHDGQQMSCAHVPAHDLLHEHYDIHSHRFTMGNSLQPYSAIDLYYSAASAVTDPVHKCGELILLQNLHERGRDLSNFQNFTRCMIIAHEVSCKFSSGAFSDMPEDYSVPSRSEFLPLGAMWVYSVFSNIEPTLNNFARGQQPLGQVLANSQQQFMMAQEHMFQRLECCQTLIAPQLFVLRRPLRALAFRLLRHGIFWRMKYWINLLQYRAISLIMLRGHSREWVEKKDKALFFEYPAASWYLLEPRFDNAWEKVMKVANGT